MSAYEKLLRPILFRLEPERAHNLALWSVAKGLIRTKMLKDPRLEVRALGLVFPNPLGLAAGCDKNGVAASRWANLGFGYAELGTVTRHAQPGNPKPRVFRIPSEKAVINRLGFNNSGAECLEVRLKGVKSSIPLGINVGKSKITPLEEAPSDYRFSFSRLHASADYAVVNVSSPNTPGLRSLQERGSLLKIISVMREINDSIPILVKVAPDLDTNALDEVIQTVIDSRASGIIATNTTIARSGLKSDPHIDGGLSGKPLFEHSNSILEHLARNSPREMILIGVGGIFSGEDLWRKLHLGANLAQVYTGWVYRGPTAIPTILLELLECMNREQVRDLKQLPFAR